MPIYEYHCKSCDEDFEVMQKFSDPPLSACPKCGKKVKRLISQTSFTLKGEGWYKDGYAKGKPESKKEEKKAEAKKETKTDKKESPPPKKGLK